MAGEKKSTNVTSCERFEELRFKPGDQLTESDVEFMFEHIEKCPFNIHTDAALDTLERMTPEELWSKVVKRNRKSNQD